MPQAGLPASGALQYNLVNFSGATSVFVSAEPVRDDADVGTKFIRYRITARTIFVAGQSSSTDGDIATIRERLLSPGGPLIFENKGFGAIRVNQGGIFDVDNGPKPEVLEWTPIGNTSAVEVLWSCTTAIPECVNGTPAKRGVVAYQYKVDVDVDPFGNPRITTTGYIQIAQNRINNLSADQVDSYWDRIYPVKFGPGIRRTVRRREFSLDRTRMDFTVVDESIPSNNPYPAKMVEVGGSHRVGWRRGGESTRFRATLSMQASPEPGIGGATAWLAFVTILRQRYLTAHNAGRYVFLDELEVEEDLWGYAQSFRAGYRFTSCVKDFIGDSGLWTPLGTDWSVWQASLSSSMFSPRGYSGGVLFPNDVVVNLCTGYATNAVSLPSEARRQVYRDRTTRGVKNEVPPANQSWLDYKAHTVPHRYDEVYRQSIIQDTPTADRASQDLTRSAPFQYPGIENGEADLIQVSGRPKYSITFLGKAARVGHKIPRPLIKSVGGRAATEVNGAFQQKSVDNGLGVPVYNARWAITYMVDGPPKGEIPYPSNPMDCADNDGANPPTT